MFNYNFNYLVVREKAPAQGHLVYNKDFIMYSKYLVVKAAGIKLLIIRNDFGLKKYLKCEIVQKINLRFKFSARKISFCV